MLDKWWTKLYPHIFKKPCKTCLVQATCKALSDRPWDRKSCDLKNEWRSREYKVEAFLNNLECFCLTSLFLFGMVLCIVTFCFGFWKWYDIGKILWVKFV